MTLARRKSGKRHKLKYAKEIKARTLRYLATDKAKQLKLASSKRYSERLRRARLYLVEHEGELGWVKNILTKPL